jgi:hypothetical protein
MRSFMKFESITLPKALEPEWTEGVQIDGAKDVPDERPMRGILLGCGISLAFWLGILIFVL